VVCRGCFRQILGRLASQVARNPDGEESPKYTTFLDTGDHVIVINAEKVKVTGMKSEQKAITTTPGTRAGCGRKNSQAF